MSNGLAAYNVPVVLNNLFCFDKRAKVLQNIIIKVQF